MGISGLRSVWYGKVQPLTIGIIAIPGVLVLVLGGAMETWVQAGIYTLVIMFGLLILGMVATGLRQVFQSAFS
jgi:ABC-type iron transport system FetAB permease component